jgi:hypothetical protein
MGVTSLGVAVFSYNGRVNFGLNADWDLFPDVDKLARGIAESLDELLRVAGVAAPAPVRRAVMPAHRAAE